MVDLHSNDSKDAAVQARRILALTNADTMRPQSGGPTGKAGDIVAEIEHRLITGRYKFGDSLSINRLAEEFDASRQPISAALNHLRSMGYLHIVPQVGCQVVAPSAGEIEDFFYMLGKIESAVAGLAATRHADGESEVLEALAKHIDGVPFDVNRHRDEWAVAVDAFHLQILAMARSPALEKRVRNLWHLSDFYLFQGASNLNPEKINLANSERHAVAAAITARSVEAAEREMELHVRGKPRRSGII